MRFGTEIIAVKAFPVLERTFFETWLEVNGVMVPKSVGRDEYLLTTEIQPGKRIMATGRLNICRVEVPGLLDVEYQARPAWPVEIILADQAAITLFIRTNSPVLKDLFKKHARLRMIERKGAILKQVTIPDPLELKWLGRGLFSVELQTYLSELLTKQGD